MTLLRKLLRTLQGPPVLVILCLACIIILSSYSSDRNLQRMTFDTSGVDETGKYSGLRREDVNGSSNIPQVRWTYVCKEGKCGRTEAKEREPMVAFEVCWLTCGKSSVWPHPVRQRRSPDTVKFLPENVRLVNIVAQSESVSRLISDAFDIKKRYLEHYPGLRHHSQNIKAQYTWPFSGIFGTGTRKDVSEFSEIMVSISTNQTDEIFTLSTDESYEISIDGGSYPFSPGFEERKNRLAVNIVGNTFFGVRHGIETFSQLVALDSNSDCLQILRAYYAYDKPAYPYRGILLDSSRNFIPMTVIKRVVDGMAMNKLNILHMHLTDSNSFPFHSKRVPQMSEYGALFPEQVYSAEELKDLVIYSRVRGVKIIPELDAPSHAGNGWQWGPKYGLGNLAFYVNVYDSSWPVLCGQPPCGILNPINVNTYDVLEQLYADLLDIFDKDLFHMGGDEVNLESWQLQPEIQNSEFRDKKMDLWKHFQTEAFKRLRKQSTNTTAIMWTSHLTEVHEVKEVLKTTDYIIQVWEPSNSPATRRLLDNGYSVILSFVDKLYLDWGSGTWLGRGHQWTYSVWQNQYDAHRKLKNFGYAFDKERHPQILGAEVTLWSEKVGPYEVEAKLWPRAAALAESFWSSPRYRNGDTYSRINYHNYRMRQRGIPTSQLQPESCLHFNGNCENPSDII